MKPSFIYALYDRLVLIESIQTHLSISITVELCELQILRGEHMFVWSYRLRFCRDTMLDS